VTLSTSGTKKITFLYILISIFTAIFGAIYELFGHGVYSYFMIYAFLFPLIGGVLPFQIIKVLPNKLQINLYNSGIATLTLGSIIKGVLDIYGTTNDIINIYWIVGSGLIIISFSIYIVKKVKGNN